MLKENPEKLPKIKMHQLDKQFFGNNKITVCKKFIILVISGVDAKSLKRLLEKKYSNVSFHNCAPDTLYVKKQFTSKVTLKEGDTYDKTKAERLTESLCDKKAFAYISSILENIAFYYESKRGELTNSLYKFTDLYIKEIEHIKDLDK